MANVSDTSTTTDNNVFEGLFVRLLKPKGAFAEELRAAGYDVEHPRMRYPTRVLRESLDIAARHVHPGLALEDAHRKLGQQFADKYLGTMIGRITRTLVVTLGVERFLMRLPRIVGLTSTGVSVTVRKLEGGELAMVFRGESLIPDFIAGAMEGGAEATAFNLRVEVVRRDAGECELKAIPLRR